MRSILFASMVALSLAGSAAYAAAPENRPSTDMQKDGNQSGAADLKATHADPGTKGSGGSSLSPTIGRSVGGNSSMSGSSGMSTSPGAVGGGTQ